MLLGSIERLPARTRWWLGSLALVLTAWASMYGKIWYFESMEAHRFTARAMMTGTLRLRSVVALAKGDEQIFNGGVYTNWGFGVPLLQIPFHALAAAAGYLHGFFPDRAIYFVYLTAAIPLFWVGFDRLLDMRTPAGDSPAQRHAASWTATWLVLNLTLFPFMSTRFVIFEETIAYMLILEFLTLSAYVWSLGSFTAGPVCAMGAAAGMALVVRPTGLLYLGVWGALVALRGQTKRTLQFAVAAAPFVAFWLFTNWVRTGAPLSLGQVNSNPAWEYETPLLRFGTMCTDTPWHTLYAAGRLFYSFFFLVSHETSRWMTDCHFAFEERDKMGDPFFGPAVLVLLCGMLWGLIRRRERNLSLYLPYAGFALLFVAFVMRGDGFAWRYEGDFWPFVVLATVQYVHTLPAAKRVPDGRMAKIMFWVGFAALARFLVPWEWTYRANILLGKDVTSMWDEFSASRWGSDATIPSKRLCGETHDVPYHDGLGWRDGCKVATFTNFYLGVPPKAGNHYTVRLKTQGMAVPRVRVYVNGQFYDARLNGDEYDVDVDIKSAALHSKLVMVTVHWGPDLQPPSGKFLSAELV